jgi:hypothetical protein
MTTPVDQDSSDVAALVIDVELYTFLTTPRIHPRG